MSLNAQGYFNALRSYINRSHYEVVSPSVGRLLLKERIFLPENRQHDITVRLNFTGEALAINLDKKRTANSTHSESLFHFLDDNGRPWSKRCDFVIFHIKSGRINVLCLEFKWETLPVERVIEQLDASEAWCRSLHSVIKHYTGKTRRLNLTKFVLSAHPDPSPYLDPENYLLRDHSIRHFSYEAIDGLSLDALENTNVDTIS